MLKSICYRSTLSTPLSIIDTEYMFDACKKNNDKLNVKGLLYKSDSYFFQITEGEAESIDALYSKIKKDRRHKDLKVLLNQPIKAFTFNDFSTGYSSVEELDTIFGLQEYLHFMETLGLPEKEEFLKIVLNLFNVKL